MWQTFFGHRKVKIEKKKRSEMLTSDKFEILELSQGFSASFSVKQVGKTSLKFGRSTTSVMVYKECPILLVK